MEPLATQVLEIKRRSVVGIVALTSRTFILQLVAFVATFILTILLDPAVFGIFFVVTAIVNFLNYFSDIGLAAALIQRKEPPTRQDFVTTFTVQQLLVGIIVIVSLIFSGKIAAFYHFNGAGLFLFRSLVAAFFLSSLKTIPSVILERQLDFQRLVIPQIIETVAFYVTAIVAALGGLGIASFAWATLVRGVTGTAVLYLVAPWRPGWSIDVAAARRLLKFGIPFQANSFLALVKDDLLTLYLGRILPLAHVGYIGWAKKWAEVALRLIMDNIIKVTFPAYSRLQHDRTLLAKAIQKSLLFLSLLTFPIAVGMVLLIDPFIAVVPRYGKWAPAIVSFYLFTASAVMATLSSPMVNALNATGRVKQTLKLMIFWTVLTWTLVPLAVSRLGFTGVAVAAVAIGVTSFAPILLLKKFVPFAVLPQLAKPALLTIVMAAVIVLTRLLLDNPLTQLVVATLAGGVSYAALAYLLMGTQLRPYFQLIRRPAP